MIHDAIRMQARTHRRASAVMIGLAFGAVVLVAPPQRCTAQEGSPRNDATFRAMIEAAAESNRDVRNEVAWALGHMGREEAVATLQTLARDGATIVQASAWRALREILPSGSRVAVAVAPPVADPVLRLATLHAASRLHFEGREALIATSLAAPAVSERVTAVQALLLDAPEASRAALIAALKDPHALVRSAAVRVVGHHSDAEALALVRAALNETTASDSFAVRAAACETFAVRTGDEDRSPLHRMTGDPHFLVRRRAIQSIQSLKDMTGLSAVQSRIAEEDYTVRVAACQALGTLIDGTSSPLLAARLADEIPEVREAADRALRGFPSDIAYKALLDWADYRERTETRERVWNILGLYGHPETREPAWAHIEDDMIPVRCAAMKILRKLADRRIIPIALAILATPPNVMNNQPPPEGMIEESFRAATLFELRDGIAQAVFVYKRALAGPESLGYMPGQDVLLAVTEYVAKYRPPQALPLLERLFTLNNTAGDPLPELMSVTLEAWTGQPHPLIQPPPRAREFSVYFLDVQTEEERQKTLFEGGRSSTTEPTE